MVKEHEMKRDIVAGIYQHYKHGDYYLLLGPARHSETEEDLIVYVALYPKEGPKMWVRPLEMFFEDVEIDGKKVPRFRYVGSEV